MGKCIHGVNYEYNVQCYSSIATHQGVLVSSISTQGNQWALSVQHMAGVQTCMSDYVTPLQPSSIMIW